MALHGCRAVCSLIHFRFGLDHTRTGVWDWTTLEQRYQWEPMTGVCAQGTCSPARMAVLKNILVLDHQRGDTTRLTPP
jgi:hypothetical protein